MSGISEKHKARLYQVRQRLRGITPPPWNCGRSGYGGIIAAAPALGRALDESEAYYEGGHLVAEIVRHRADSQFIIFAPDDIKFLLDLVGQLDAERPLPSLPKRDFDGNYK